MYSLRLGLGVGCRMLLPEDVIEHIFYKLPVSSLLSARAVCKSWKARLDRSEFRELYHLNCTRENQWLVVGRAEARVIYIYNTSLDRWFKIPITWSWMAVCGGAGGLLVVCKFDKFVVGNPITNDWKELPPVPALGYVKYMGMAKGADANSYKVVVLAHQGCSKVTPMVYDSEVGHWSVQKSRDINMLTSTHPVVCNGVIYAADWPSDSILKYNVEMDELGYVIRSLGDIWTSWFVPWKGNIFMFEQPYCEPESLGVWVVHNDEWVLLSRSSWSVCCSMLWLDGDMVKIFREGQSCMITYNLAVADSWRLVEAESPPLLVANLIRPSVCMPLSLTAAP